MCNEQSISSSELFVRSILNRINQTVVTSRQLICIFYIIRVKGVHIHSEKIFNFVKNKTVSYTRGFV